MTDVDCSEIEFQCPSCDHDLKQTIARLKAERHMICPGCGIEINIDSDRLANAADEVQKEQPCYGSVQIEALLDGAA